MDTFILLAKIFGISFTSGINLYATVALVGLAIRFNFITNLPDQLNILSNEYIIGTALTLYVCEFIADKIPAFDSVWDSIHTFIRPFAAAMLALMAAGDCPLYIQIIAVLVAGAVAATSHTAKSGIRLLVNTSPEPFSNSIVSIAEDIGVFVLITLILTHPIIAAIIVAILLLIIIWFGPKLLGFIKFTLKSIALRICSFMPNDKHINVEIIPQKHDKYLNKVLEQSEKVYLTIETTFNGDKKGSGYIVLTSNKAIILYKKWFSIRHIEFNLAEIKRMCFHCGFLVDTISFNHNDKPMKIILFKSNNRNLNDVKSLFRSLEVDIVEPVPEASLSKARI